MNYFYHFIIILVLYAKESGFYYTINIISLMALNKSICVNEIINYIDIKNTFKENIGTKQIHISKIVQDIEKHMKNKINDYSRYEKFTPNKYRKISMDIEGIPKDEDFRRLIHDFSNFFKENYNKEINYVSTRNVGGSPNHPGLSYHFIVTNFNMNYMDMKKLIIAFIKKHQEYKDYIDLSLYTSIRLFKLPYYYGINKENGYEHISKIETNNYHEFYISNIEYTISDFIITYLRCSEHINNIFNISRIDIKQYNNNLSGMVVKQKYANRYNQLNAFPYMSSNNIRIHDLFIKISEINRNELNDIQLKRLKEIEAKLDTGSNMTQTELLIIQNILNMFPKIPTIIDKD